MVGRFILVAILAFPPALQAQPDWSRELQRDMALLQDQVRVSDEKLEHLTSLMEQMLLRMGGLDTSVTSMEDSLAERQRDLVSAPMAAMGAQIESMANEFGFVRESVAGISTKISSLQTQITDLRTTMTVLSAPPAPPGEEGGLPPTISAEMLFSFAQRDQSGGKLDSALEQYQQFLSSFPSTDLAPAAQYGIGEIYYESGKFEDAVQAFDNVLERYPDNDKTPDAIFMKAQCLVRTGSDRAAAIELRDLIRRFPNTELAEKATAELERLGFAAE